LADSNGNSGSPRELAQSLVALREELLDSNMSSEEINAILQAYAGRPTVELVKPLEVWSDQELEDEADRRQLSWLTLESNDELLAEVERRELMTSKSGLSEDEFEREAIKRGFHVTLAEFPIEEIKSYLKIQGHSSGNSGNSGNSNRGGRRPNNNNNQHKRRRNHSRSHSNHSGK
jgi:hypothetical protein